MHPTRILLIEDDIAFGSVAAALIAQAAADTEWSASVAHVRTWSEGYPLSNRFDLVLLDLDLPDSDTEQTIARLSECGANMPPVVLLTGRDIPAIRRRAFLAGAQDFIWRSDLTINPITTFHRFMHAIWRKQRDGSQDQRNAA